MSVAQLRYVSRPLAGEVEISPSIDIAFHKIQTDIIRLANAVHPVTGAIETPLSTAVTYAAQTSGDRLAQSYDGGQGYGVYRNSTWEMLEKILCRIEEGSEALAVSTGRAAIDLVLRLLPANSHIIVAPDGLYPGTRRLFDALAAHTGLQVSYVDATAAALEAARQPNTRLVFTEPVTNPLLKISDLAAIAAFAHKHRLLSVADNTLTPLLARPFAQGFDLVIQSLTKYISGHNNTLGGAIVFNHGREDLAATVRGWRNITGATLSPHDAHAIIQYAKDFPTRLKLHCETAFSLATWLERQPGVARVYYPGLASNPDRQLAQRQFGAFGGLVSFELAGGEEAARRFLAVPKNIFLADSLGTDSSLLNYYSLQSTFFRNKSPLERARYGITPGFFRLAVGREDLESIQDDLAAGLRAAA